MAGKQSLILAALMAFAALGCNSQEGRAQKFTEPYPAKVERRDIVGYKMLDQAALYIPPEAQAVIYPKYHAPVEKVMASVGQQVNRGETIIQLNFPDAEAAYEQAKAQVQMAQQAYDQARAQSSSSLKQAQAALEQARAAEKQAREQAKTTGDNTALAAATQQRMTAEQAVQAEQATLNASLDPYKEQLEAAQQAMADAKNGVRQGSLKSPIAGTVTYLDVQPGQVVGDDANKVLAKIVNLAAIKIKAVVPSDEAALIDEGKNVTIQFQELSDKTFDGKVSKVEALPAKDGTTVKQVTIDFKNDNYAIKDGFHVAWVGVKVDDAKNVLAVPVGAVKLDSTGKPIVNVLQAGKWSPRVVETGVSDGKFVEIKSGLEEGETVQVNPKS